VSGQESAEHGMILHQESEGLEGLVFGGEDFDYFAALV
jgi:hypothetical protein